MLTWGSLGWGSQTRTGSRSRTAGPSGCPEGSSSGDRESWSGTWIPLSVTPNVFCSSENCIYQLLSPSHLPSYLSRRVKEPNPSARVLSGSLNSPRAPHLSTFNLQQQNLSGNIHTHCRELSQSLLMPLMSWQCLNSWQHFEIYYLKMVLYFFFS